VQVIKGNYTSKHFYKIVFLKSFLTRYHHQGKTEGKCGRGCIAWESVQQPSAQARISPPACAGALSAISLGRGAPGLCSLRSPSQELWC